MSLDDLKDLTMVLDDVARQIAALRCDLIQIEANVAAHGKQLDIIVDAGNFASVGSLAETAKP